jgi:hypothetical protein
MTTLRADGAVSLCGKACGLLGTTGVALRVPVGGIAEAVVPGCHSVDGRGAEISLATGDNGMLSTIHRPTTTTKREIERVLGEDGEEGQ